VLCIFGIVYVHAWTGLDGSQLAAGIHTGQSLLRWILMEIFGRSAVPLLSIISGWLFTASTRQRSYPQFVIGKFRVIYLPMVLWNGLSILLVSGSAYLGLLAAPVPTSLWWFLDELLCLVTPNDINVQTAFLRDLFLCFLVAPFVLRLNRFWFSLLVIVVAAWVISASTFPLLLRPQIFLFFLFGIYARRHALAERVARISLLPTAISFLCVAVIKTYVETGWPEFVDANLQVVAAFDIVARIIAAACFWRLAIALSATRTGALVKQVEPYAFMMFCAHLIMIWLAGSALGTVTGPMGSPYYPAYLLIQPLLVLGATILLGRALLVISPGAARLLSGGRLRRAE
jgi:hypothetical protein